MLFGNGTTSSTREISTTPLHRQYVAMVLATLHVNVLSLRQRPVEFAEMTLMTHLLCVRRGHDLSFDLA